MMGHAIPPLRLIGIVAPHTVSAPCALPDLELYPGAIIVVEGSTSAAALGRCPYCGVYGALGRCQGCGAPNQPTTRPAGPADSPRRFTR